MKIVRIIFVLFFTLSYLSFHKEVEAVRPPLKPLNREQFHKMITDADVIATGTITSVRLTKTLQPPLETVIIHVTMILERILKGDNSIENIAIEESYKQFSVNNIEDVPDSRGAKENIVKVAISGPAPQVGRYREGDRILVFLKSIGGLNIFRPLGSGNHDAYFGVFQISSEGVTSDRYRFDEVVTGYAKSEADFLDIIISMKGE